MSTILYNTSPNVVGFHYGGPPNLQEILAPGLYTLRLSPQGPYLERGDLWTCNEPIFGYSKFLRERFVNTALERSQNPKRVSTGMLFYGPAGVGKTMLGRYIGSDLVKKGLPIINIPSNIDNIIVAKVCEDIKQPCVIFIDEFEKRFEVADNESEDPQQQNIFLSLLDGTSRTSHIYILTANTISRLNSYLFNRPGRIYYKIKFDFLDEKTIVEYLNGHNVTDNVKELVIEIAKKVKDLTFDQLSAIVEECTRYPEDKALMIAQRLNVDYFSVNYNDDYKVFSHNLVGKSIAFNGATYPINVVIEKDDIISFDIDRYDAGSYAHVTVNIKNIHLFETDDDIKVVRGSTEKERQEFKKLNEYNDVYDFNHNFVFSRSHVIDVDSFKGQTSYYNDGIEICIKTAYSVKSAYSEEDYYEFETFSSKKKKLKSLNES